jgi:hypothetical protein
MDTKNRYNEIVIDDRQPGKYDQNTRATLSKLYSYGALTDGKSVSFTELTKYLTNDVKLSMDSQSKMDLLIQLRGCVEKGLVRLITVKNKTTKKCFQLTEEGQSAVISDKSTAGYSWGGFYGSSASEVNRLHGKIPRSMGER